MCLMAMISAEREVEDLGADRRMSRLAAPSRMNYRRGNHNVVASPRMMFSSGSFYPFSLAQFGFHEEESAEAEAEELGEEMSPTTTGPNELGETPSGSNMWFKVVGPKGLIDDAAHAICIGWAKLGRCGEPFVKKQCTKTCQRSGLGPPDEGASARCESVAPPHKPGTKKCPIGKYQLARYKEHGADKPTVGFPASCPDGIGWQGVYENHEEMGGHCIPWHRSQAANGVLRCERHTCLNRNTKKPMPVMAVSQTGSGSQRKFCPAPGIHPFKGVCDEEFCDESGAAQVCQKFQVLHVHGMSRSAGILIMKRTSCTVDKGHARQCAVFKTGLCIDLLEDVWSSSFNYRETSTIMSIQDAAGGLTEQAKKFGLHASRLLMKYNNTLPEKHSCSDTRHKWTYQTKHSTTGKPGQNGKWYTWKSANTTNKDETLSRFTILNF